jgi:hypothetical protein
VGTNYYYQDKPPCGCCGRPFGDLHIGKSSAGWCFSLHVIPEEDINSLEDWKRRWKTGGVIVDEYGERLTPEEMLRVITERHRIHPMSEHFDWSRNHAEPGPGNLARHAIGRYCVGHGDGTYDLIPGEFS